MKTLLQKLFLENWQRKATAIFLAIIVWFVVNHSLTGTKTIPNVPIRITNLPPDKTVEGLQTNGILNKRVDLTLMGKNSVLEELTTNDLEIEIDASNITDEWQVSISKKNLSSNNPEIDISQDISKVFYQNFTIRLTKLVTEKIPVHISPPVGEPPKEYQLLDIWPYQLSTTVSGPEEKIKILKRTGVKLTFNLSKITRSQLQQAQEKSLSKKEDIVTFFVPDEWKYIDDRLISDIPVRIDDPQVKNLRIDFIRTDLLPISRQIPISIFFPVRSSAELNPQTCSIISSEMVKLQNNVPVLSGNFYAKGVSPRFLQTVMDKLQIVVSASPNKDRTDLEWSIQFVTPHVLENRYVAMSMSDVSDQDLRDSKPYWKEEYLRNRFRSFMNEFRLYKADNTKLDLVFKVQDNAIQVQEWKPTENSL